jgi:hypothetical protein
MLFTKILGSLNAPGTQLTGLLSSSIRQMLNLLQAGTSRQILGLLQARIAQLEQGEATS